MNLISLISTIKCIHASNISYNNKAYENTSTNNLNCDERLNALHRSFDEPLRFIPPVKPQRLQKKDIMFEQVSDDQTEFIIKINSTKYRDDYTSKSISFYTNFEKNKRGINEQNITYGTKQTEKIMLSFSDNYDTYVDCLNKDFGSSYPKNYTDKKILCSSITSEEDLNKFQKIRELDKDIFSLETFTSEMPKSADEHIQSSRILKELWNSCTKRCSKAVKTTSKSIFGSKQTYLGNNKTDVLYKKTDNPPKQYFQRFKENLSKKTVKENIEKGCNLFKKKLHDRQPVKEDAPCSSKDNKRKPIDSLP